MTNEDIIPNWLRRELMRMGLDPSNDQWPPRHTIRMCSVCNQRLKVEFEDTASPILKPMMHGTPVVLDRQQRLIVSRWILKTAALDVLKDVLKVSGNPTICVTLINDILLGEPEPSLAPGVFVRLFQTPEDTFSGVEPRLGHIVPTAGFPSPCLLFHVGRFGQIAYELVVAKPMAIYEYASKTATAARSVNIWPAEGCVGWPPRRETSSQDIELLRNAHHYNIDNPEEPTYYRWLLTKDGQWLKWDKDTKDLGLT